MRVFAVAPALSILLAAAPTFAQAPAGQPRPAAPAGQSAPAPRPQTQTPPPAQQPAPQTPARPALVPFQDGFKYGYVRVELIAAESADGRKATADITALRTKLQKELDDKNKALQANQQKLETGGSVLSESARTQLQTDIERQQRDIQRAAEDAQQDVERLTQRLQQAFIERLNPIIERVAQEKQVHMIFNASESGLMWAAPGMDLTMEIIKALDGGATAKPAATAPAAPAPAPSAPPPAAPAPASPR